MRIKLGVLLAAAVGTAGLVATALPNAWACVPFVCNVNSTIVSNFNGTPIAEGRTIWFNANLKVNSRVAPDFAVRFVNQQISFDAGGQHYDLQAPDARIRFINGLTTASTHYNAAENIWETQVPHDFGKEILIGGFQFTIPAGGLPGGINPVTWTGTFQLPKGISLNWKWGAAVYTSFSPDYNALGVKPVDGSTQNPYNNSDHAGTPENFKSFVIGGARGGGGSNFTGSWSGTKSASCT